MAPPPAAMPAAPASSSRSRDPRLFGSFDLPAGWGCRRHMAFCKGLDVLVSESNAAAAEPQANTFRSPKKGASPAEDGAAAQEAPRKQWNLRERKAGRDFEEGARQNKELWNMYAGGGSGGKKCRGFSVELTRQEIEPDFVAIAGRKPPRRPKKHPKNVQRQIDTLCPGSSLSEVSCDRYKVNEKGGF